MVTTCSPSTLVGGGKGNPWALSASLVYAAQPHATKTLPWNWRPGVTVEVSLSLPDTCCAHACTRTQSLRSWLHGEYTVSLCLTKV